MTNFTRYNKYRKSPWMTFWFAILFVSGLASAAQAQTFTSAQVETGTDCNWPFNDVAVNPSDGKTYGFWRKGSGATAVYKLIRWDGSSWATVGTFTTSGGTGSSVKVPNFDRASDIVGLAIDAQGHFHVTFQGERGPNTCCNSTRGVWYGFSNDGVSWTFTEVQTFSDPNGWKNTGNPVIEVDASNHPHIAFNFDDVNGNRSHELHYSYYNGTTWTTQTAFSQTGASNEVLTFDLAIDGNGKASIAFQRETNGSGLDGGLYYITNSSGSWSSATELAHGNTNQQQGQTIAIDTDAGNKVHIVYSDYQQKLYYLTNTSGSFAGGQINGNATGNTYPHGFRINSNGDKFIALGVLDFTTYQSTIGYAYQLSGGSGVNGWTTGQARGRSANANNYFSGLLNPTDNRMMFLFDQIADASNTNCGASNPRNLWYTTATIPGGQPATATVSSINTTSPNPTNAASINFTVTFDKSVTGGGAANFSLTTTGAVSGASIGTVSGSGSTRTVAVNTGTGSGTIRLNMVNSTGVTPTLTNVPFTTGATVTIDKTGPAVSSVTVPTNGTYRTGQNLSFTVNFNDNTTVTGTPSLPLTIGTTTVQAAYISGSGTAGLVFRYTVLAGQQDDDGIQVGSAITLNGGSLKDGLGNEATLTLNSVASTAGVKVDAVAPTLSISSSAGASGGTTSTSPLPFTLTFSESVTGLTSAGITVTNGTLSGFTGSGTMYTFSVTPTVTNGLVSVNVSANAAQDAAGNGNTAASPFSITYNQPITPTPLVNSPATGTLTSNNTPTYSGTAPAGSTVTVYVDGSSIGTTTATGGNWSLTQPTPLTNSNHMVYVTAQLSGYAVSANSNTNSFTVDNSTLSLTLSASAVCATSSFSLTATAMNTGSPVSYVLSSSPTGFSGSGTSSQFTLVAPSVSSATTYTLTVAATSNAGNPQATVVVTVNPLPTPLITNLNAAYCKDAAAVTLSGTPVGGVFTLDGTTATSFTPASLSVGQHTVIYSYTNASGCSNTTSQAVTINAVPNPAITSLAAAYCKDAAAVPLSGTPAGGVFTIDGTTATSLNPANLSVGQHTVVYSYTNSSGCSATASQMVTINALPTPTITNLAAAYCKDATAVTLAGSPSGGVFTIDGATATIFNPASLSVGQHTVVYSYTNANGCSASRSQGVTVKEVPQTPTLVTQNGGSYPAGVSSLTISQSTGNVILTVSGCAGGTISWNGGNATTLAVATTSTGVFTFTANCTSNGCVSPLATATVTVVGPTLKVFSRDPDNGQLNSNTIKPYLLLQNVGATPIPYGTITVRYWLTTENTIPLILQTNYVQIGQNNVQIRYVPLSTPLQGATGYIEYSFNGAAGSLLPGSDSGPIETQIYKQDYSAFNQLDDYSYINNSAYTLNPRITAYQNGVIFYGQEPGAGSPRLAAKEAGTVLSVRVLGNPVVGQTAQVEISGVEGQRVALELVDQSGRRLQTHQIEQATAVDRVNLEVGSLPGVLLLQVSTPTQRQSLKILKP